MAGVEVVLSVDVSALRETLEAIAGPAFADVVEECRRQWVVEGFTAEHDDAHDNGDLALAAACYASNAAHWAERGFSVYGLDYAKVTSTPPPRRWPWSKEWWKPKSQRRDLVRAAALIISEIRRLDRAAARAAARRATQP